MTLSQNGLNYICQNFGDASLCCVRTGLSWYYTLEGTDYPENGGTAQVVSRLASGLIESLTMTSPARGMFTQAELNAANSGPVTLEDAKLVAEHDDTSADQWCYGAPPPPSSPPIWKPIVAMAPIFGISLVVNRWDEVSKLLH